MREVVLGRSVQGLPVKDIVVGERQRPVRPEAAEALAATIAEEGLHQPILVRRIKHRGGELRLVAGAHRLAAHVLLGREEIDAIVVDSNDDQARAMEIDENLQRRALEPLDLALALEERKRLHERMHPESRNGGDRRSAAAIEKRSGTEASDQNDRMTFWSFARVAAESLGQSQRTVERAVRVGAAVREAGADAFRGMLTPPKMAELLLFADVPGAAARGKVAQILRDDPGLSIPEAIARLANRTAPPMKRPVDRARGYIVRLSRGEMRELVEDHWDLFEPHFEAVRAARGEIE